MAEEQGQWLSDILKDTSRLQSGVLNLIHSPCGSGKSSWCFDILAPRVKEKHKIVYLIDTISGKEQFLKREDTQHYDEHWREIIKGEWGFFLTQKIVVMTYAKFGSLAKRDVNFGHSFEYIVCDEAHSLIMFQYFSEDMSNCHRIAREQLQSICFASKVKVVAITATPQLVRSGFRVNFNEVLSEEEIKSLKTYPTDNIEYFTNIKELLRQRTSSGGKGILYTQRIEDMIAFETIAAEYVNVGAICMRVSLREKRVEKGIRS